MSFQNLINKRLAISTMHNKNHVCLVMEGKDRYRSIYSEGICNNGLQSF